MRYVFGCLPLLLCACGGVPGPTPEEMERYRREAEVACVRDCTEVGLSASWEWSDEGDLACWCIPEGRF